MSFLLSKLEGEERRAECAKHESAAEFWNRLQSEAADRRRRKWVAAAEKARQEMGECDCEAVMVLELDGLHAGRTE